MIPSVAALAVRAIRRILWRLLLFQAPRGALAGLLDIFSISASASRASSCCETKPKCTASARTTFRFLAASSGCPFAAGTLASRITMDRTMHLGLDYASSKSRA